MRPAHFHAPGAPNRLPNQPPTVDRKGNVLCGGETQSFQKVLRSLRKHHQEELNRTRRDRA